jgi:pyruvate dehydrogenase E2 component (dihydrolipoamide acetyltransferase)
MIEVLLPDIGDFHDVEVIEILVKPGDRVEAEDPLITLESDKASMEIPSPHAGVVGEVRVVLGDKINQGDLLLLFEPVAGGETDDANGLEPESAELIEDAVIPEPVPETRPVPASAGNSQVRDITLPDIGDFKDVEIIELLVSAGDDVEVEQSLLTLESDKATMEIPSPCAGTVKSVEVTLGNKVNRGDLVARIENVVATETTEPDAPPAETATVTPAESVEAAPLPRAPGEKEPMPVPVCADLHASWEWTCITCRVPAPRGGLQKRMYRNSSSDRWPRVRRLPRRRRALVCSCRRCQRWISPSSARSRSRSWAGSRS